MNGLRTWVLIIGVALLATLTACGRRSEPPQSGELALAVDTTLEPSQDTLPDAEGNPRPVARMVGSSGVAMDFVLNELVVSTDDETKLNAFVARWGGTILAESDSADDVPNTYQVQLDPSAAQVETILRELNHQLPDLEGEFTTSSDAAAKLLAVALHEANREGITITPNFVVTPSDIASGATSEAPSSSDGRYTPNAFDWTYMNRGSPQDIGVGAAWQTLQRGGRFSNRVPIMIMDGGFVPNADFPTRRRIIGSGWNVPNAADCGSGNPCPWHGTHVVTSAMGLPDNDFGVAGPAGPVAELIAVQFNMDFFDIIATLMDTARALPEVKIINLSFSFELDVGWDIAVKAACLGLCPSPSEVLHGVATALSGSGKLIFAAAGNDGRDVDRGGAIESSRTVPCELNTVICVGGMAHNATARDPGSNFGSKRDDNSVDIYGPYWVWVGPDPDNPDNAARLRSGTSYASPFVAGVAALVWAADPSLNARQVWDILRDTAHSGGVGVPGHNRRVNAFGAVARVLGGEPPTVTLSDSPTSSPLNREWSVTATVTDPEYGAGFCPPSACPLTWSPEPTRIVGNTAFYRFTTAGSQTVIVTAADLVGQTASASRTVNVVNSPPIVAISQPTAGASFFVGQTVQLLGSATDLNEGPDPGPGPIACNWTSSNVSDTAFPRTGCNTEVTFSDTGSRVLTLRATDPQGLSSAATVTITVNPAPANLPPTITLGTLSPEINYNGDGYDWETTLSATASATDPEGDTPITYTWRATSLRPNSTTVWRSDVVLSTSTTSGNLSWTPSSNNPSNLLGDFGDFGNDCYFGQVVRLTLEARDSLGNASFRSLPDIKVYRCILF